MLTRRQLLTRTLQGSSLLALGSVVPEFIAQTALAAEPGKDNLLVIIEMNGGNDGLNTVIPYGDDLYHKARPTLGLKKDQVIKVNDQVGLNPGMRGFERLLQAGQLAIVQGVGYPNPDRSHFESMDIWQSADPARKTPSGWVGRASADLVDARGNIPIMNIGSTKLPLTLVGGSGGAISINNRQPYKLELGGGEQARHKARRQLLESLTQADKEEDPAGLLSFVKRREVQTLSTLDRLQEVLKGHRSNEFFFGRNGKGDAAKNLPLKLQLVARLIQANFGTRVFYVMRDDFDTHSDQAETHKELLGEVADGIANFFDTLKGTGHDQRVRVLTFSEFGRRVQENSSKGTDHGAASCLFVAGPSVKGGVVGNHPSLKDLDSGDLKHSIDFRRVYATLLDTWLGCSSATVLRGKWEHLDGLKPKA